MDSKVQYARHAISIDERRKNFPRVGWAHSEDVKLADGRNPEWLKQVWFSGNHSDIGGSYPEAESRLSDITLTRMIEQINEVEYPVLMNKDLLNLYPKSDGMQHCEIKSMREKLYQFWSWSSEDRDINSKAILHSSVIQRFKLKEISDYGKIKIYRPISLMNHEETSKYFENKGE